MSSPQIAVSVRDLSKSYTIAHQAVTHVTLAEAVLDRLRHPFRRSDRETFWALKDVSFDIHVGDVVGIIGRNGAGKSTLLKILSRITEPTTGQIDLYGRVGSLLEVGTGFHPELSGRENIFLNGAILGMTKQEIRKQFDAIVDFAGVEKFLDTPVKRYSSGMYVRLAFAVAAHLESEILVVDEVLAVGDAEFQRKCLGKMRDVAGSGRTVLFVSHQMQAITTLCTTAIYLENGQLKHSGDVTTAVEQYLSYKAPTTAAVVRRPGSGELRVIDLVSDKPIYHPTDTIVVDMSVQPMRSMMVPYFVSVEIVNALGLRVLHLDSRLLSREFDASEPKRIRFTIRNGRLAQGDYQVNVFLCTREGMIDRIENALQVRIAPLLPYPLSTGDIACHAIVYPDFSVEEETTANQTARPDLLAPA